MFQVNSVETNNTYTVYAAQEIRGVIYFLMYNTGHWYWIEAEKFIPHEPEIINVPYPVYPAYPYTPTPIQDDWWKQPYVFTSSFEDSGGNKIK